MIPGPEIYGLMVLYLMISGSMITDLSISVHEYSDFKISKFQAGFCPSYNKSLL